MRIKVIILSLLLGGIFLTSCSKEKKIIDHLQGVWSVTSLQIEAEEYMESTYTNFEADFKTYDRDEGVGITQWVLTDINDRDTYIDGEYRLLENGERVEIKLIDDAQIFEMTIDAANLELIGTINNEVWHIIAEK